MSQVGSRLQRAYHGTVHRGIEQFSTDRIGTGEGAQAYGWGLYFASKREIADWYRRTLAAGNHSISDFDFAAARKEAERAELAVAELEQYAIDHPDDALRVQRKLNAERAALLKAQACVADAEAERRNPGRLYEVDIPDDGEMLLWDKPLSEQPPKVVEALIASGLIQHWPVREEDDFGCVFYRRMAAGGQRVPPGFMKPQGAAKQVSELLRAAGIKGIKYLDGTSRGQGQGTHNFVTFDGADVQVRAEHHVEEPLRERARG